MGNLSRGEIVKLQGVARRHEDDEWVLSRLTHDFPEWRKNVPGKSCRPITLEDLLAGIGEDATSTSGIAEDAREAARLHRLFGG